MNLPSHLIHAPHRQQRLQRHLWQLLTAVCWAAYLYLWLPLFTLLLWLVGIRVAVFELYERRDQVDPFVLLALPAMALICALLLIGWAEYNRIRFQGRERRQKIADVPREELAAALGARDEVAAAMLSHKIQVLRMDDHAHPQATRALPTRMPSRATRAQARAAVAE